MKPPAFWSARDDISLGISRLLEPMGLLYGAVVKARLAWTKPERVGVPVICVGNLTLGGAGKTPVALALARHLRAKGRTPHFLTRGYGGSLSGPVRVDPAHHRFNEVGDEPLLLAGIAPTWVSRDRPAGARAAQAAGADVIIMDDGYQNPSLVKDLSFVVVDGAVGFGNRKIFPAGPLRESLPGGLDRASALIVLGQDRTGVAGRVSSRLPVLTAEVRPAEDIAGRLRGQRVVAFAGIGRPEKFFATLKALGALVLAEHPFDDHYPYADTDVQPILDEAYGLNAAPVTTAKDAVRLPPDQRQQVSVLTVDLVWANEDALDAVLSSIL